MPSNHARCPWISRVVQAIVTMGPLTDYERERQERIARNRAILASLDIPTAKNAIARRLAKPALKPTSNKRKRRASQSDRDSNGDTGERPAVTRRTSARLQQRVAPNTSLSLIIFSLFGNTKRAIARNGREMGPISRYRKTALMKNSIKMCKHPNIQNLNPRSV